jgi:hypothetical protein
MKKLIAGIVLAAAAAAPALVAAVPASAQTVGHLVGLFPDQGSYPYGAYMLYSNGRVVPVGEATFDGSNLGRANNFVALMSFAIDPHLWRVTSTGPAI